MKRRLLEQHDKDSYTFDTRKSTQVNRRGKEARIGFKRGKRAVRRQDKEIEALLTKNSSDEAKLRNCEVDIKQLNDEIKEYSSLHLRASSQGRPFADEVRICFMELLTAGVSANICAKVVTSVLNTLGGKAVDGSYLPPSINFGWSSARSQKCMCVPRWQPIEARPLVSKQTKERITK